MVTTAGALRVALPRRDGGEGAQAKLTPAAHTDFYGSRRRTSKEASGAGAGARWSAAVRRWRLAGLGDYL